MSQPKTIRARRNWRLLMLLFLLLPGLACKTLMPSAPETREGTRVSYPTGIETLRSADGVIVVVDHKGSYGMALPEQWEVGAFHEDFVPTVGRYCEINNAVCTLFQALYEKDSSARIFAIDTSHLAKDNIAILHVGMFQDEQRLQASIEDLAAAYLDFITASGDLKVIDTYQGTTDDGSPFAILLTQPDPITENSVYSAELLIKTDKVYLEIIYNTLDETINIVDELTPILKSFTANVQ